MKWSAKLGRLAGIDINVHATFALLLAWVVLRELMGGGQLVAVLSSLAFVLAIFGTVVLHELGHALTARRFGIGTQDITLYPIGGVAKLERMPEEPRQELLVALAGPAVNLVIAAVLFAIGALLGVGMGVPLGGPATAFLASLAWANVGIAVFNLIPAFPMDGGRALRALLSLKNGRLDATRTAVKLGKGLAVVFAILGLFSNPMLLLIALFVWMAASGEGHVVEAQARQAPQGWSFGQGEQPIYDAPSAPRVVSSRDGWVPVTRRAPAVAPRSPAPPSYPLPWQRAAVSPFASLHEVASQAWGRDLTVVHQGRIVGTLPYGVLVMALHRGYGGLRVVDVMNMQPRHGFGMA